MIRKAILIGVLTFLYTTVNSLQYTKTVQTTYGALRGEEVYLDGVQFKAFRGIPFANPPTGELRFKAPQPPDTWSRVRDATRYGHLCHQPNMFMRLKLDLPFLIRDFFSNARNLIGVFHRMLRCSEDCLTLNVYTTQLGGEGLKPVLVFIHGGAFVVGDGTDAVYGPDYLVQRDIVIVTTNYRLGVLGFLSTNTTDAPGNWGLKDQVAALRWIRDNIAQFGGNPKQVTIYGHSSGAASVHLHMFSPLSKGLFQRAIMASGSATCPWAVNDHQIGLSQQLAEMVGASKKEAEDPGKRITFLRSVKGKVLSEKIMDILNDQIAEDGIFKYIPFSAVVEPPETKDAFLTQHPKKLIAQGRFAKVPLMVGFTDLEGGLLYLGFSKFNSTDDIRKSDVDVCNILPMHLRDAVEEKNACPKVSQQILDLYFGGKPANSSALRFTHMYGDLFLLQGVYEAQKWHARYSTKDSPVYFYYYTYDKEWNLLKDLIALKLPGVIHGDEMDYIFKPKMAKLRPLMQTGLYNQERLLSFISNFVKYGNPTPSLTEAVPIPWEAASENDLNTMRIGADLKMEKGVLKDRLNFWNSLNKKYLGTSMDR